MNILAIDASGSICSVAVTMAHIRAGNQFLETKEIVRSHSQFILPMIDSCLKKAELSLSDVELCVYSKGPGSFTGLRLVTAVVQGLAYNHGMKLMGISSMRALAQAVYDATGQEDILICEDARMEEVYACHYQLKDRCMEPVKSERCITPEKLLKEIARLKQEPYLFGSGLDVYPEFSDYEWKIPYEAKILAPALIHLSQNSSTARIFTDPAEVLPSYIRTPTYKKRQRTM